MGDERGGGKEGQTDGATPDGNGKALGWLSPDVQLHPCISRENNAHDESISTRPLNNINYIRKQFEWKFSRPEEFKRNEDFFGY